MEGTQRLSPFSPPASTSRRGTTPLAEAGAAEGVPAPAYHDPAASKRYERTNFLYLIRVGISASGPLRRFKSSMYAP